MCLLRDAWLRAANSICSNFKHRKLKLQLPVIHRTKGVDPDSRQIGKAAGGCAACRHAKGSEKSRKFSEEIMSLYYLPLRT